MGSRAGKISYLCGSAVKLLCWGPPGKRESDDKHTHCPGPNPAPGAALKCFLLAYCFRKDGIHFNKFAFNKNPSWRICRPRRAEAWKNGYVGGGAGALCLLLRDVCPCDGVFPGLLRCMRMTCRVGNATCVMPCCRGVPVAYAMLERCISCI